MEDSRGRDEVFLTYCNPVCLSLRQSELVSELFQQKPVGGSLSLSGGKSSLPNGSLRSGPGKRAQREHKLTVGFQVLYVSPCCGQATPFISSF